MHRWYEGSNIAHCRRTLTLHTVVGRAGSNLSNHYMITIKLTYFSFSFYCRLALRNSAVCAWWDIQRYHFCVEWNRSINMHVFHYLPLHLEKTPRHSLREPNILQHVHCRMHMHSHSLTVLCIWWEICSINSVHIATVGNEYRIFHCLRLTFCEGDNSLAVCSYKFNPTIIYLNHLFSTILLIAHQIWINLFNVC